MSDPYLYQPREISIETLTLCNARCEFCPYDTLDRKGARMSDELLVSILNQLREWREPFHISPFKVNEPFLDKRFLPLCRDIVEGLPMAKIRIFTNGSRFTNDNVAELMDLPPSRIEHIWVSLNTTDADEYKRIMGYVTFEHVAEKIDILFKAWLRRIRHRIVISRVAGLPTDADEQRKRVDFESYIWKRWRGFIPYHIKRDGWIGYTHASDVLVPKTPCARWWELNIMATGKAALCCMDGTGEYSVGDANTETLKEIYTRTLPLRVSAWKRDEFSPCNRCTY